MIYLVVNSQKFSNFQSRLEKRLAELPEQIFQAIELSALDIQTRAKQPGYVPIDTGTLRRSITHKTIRSGADVTGYVGTNVKYARIHEFGGQTGRNHSVTIVPKLYLTRATKESREAIAKRFKALALISGKI